MRRLARRGWHDVASPGRLGDAAADEAAPAALRAYLRLLHHRPLATTTATATATAALGDMCAQFMTWTDLDTRLGALIGGEGRAPFRGSSHQAVAELAAEPTMMPGASVELGPVRTLRFALLTGGLVGGLGELWFRRVLLVSFPGWTYDVLLRTVFDQAFFAPAVLAMVVGSTAVLSIGGDAAYAEHKLKQDGVHSLGKMWALWSGSAAASYLLVPTPWQPPFAMGLSVVWAFYVSRRAHLPTASRGFAVSHSPVRVGAYLRDESTRAQR